MKVTPTARRVLQAFADASDGSIGARSVSEILWPDKRRRYLRAGQYMGKLARQGWLSRHHDTYIGRRGHECYAGARYTITPAGRRMLR